MEIRRITEADYQQLISLKEKAAFYSKMPHLVDQFYQELLNAELYKKDQISQDVIVMNAEVGLKDRSSGRFIKLKLTYPKEADPNEFSISVFSPIGMAIIGRSVGDHITWKIHSMKATFEILEVSHQLNVMRS